MEIGIPKEILDNENRVGATPSMVRSLVESGHKVLVQTHAGRGSGFSDEAYKQAGGIIVESALYVYQAEMVIKVKEPQPAEYPLLKENQIIFCFLHLAPNKALTQQLIDSKSVAIAYETVTDKSGRLPLLIPMSEIAGRMAVHVGAAGLQIINGGKGIVLGGVPGVLPGKVVILGGGVGGTEAARLALGVGADVTIIDINMARLKELDMLFGPRLKTLFSSSSAIEDAVVKADLLIGSVLIPGKTAPRLLTEKIISQMEPGSVIVDVSIDQGGCSETSKPTHHSSPYYLHHDIVHYCVVNMPGACARTSTMALTNATLAYALKLANEGYRVALSEDPGLRNGLNVCKGHVTNEHIAFDLGYEYAPPEQII